MAKIKRKGTTGNAKNYITRTQAVRKLQISLPDFRRLCIFKGIYPREPRNKKKVSKGATPSTTFYYTKDIQYLLHEPLINKFREHKALAKKIGKALGRGEVGDASRLEKSLTPKFTLDHIIKERYPTFVDALRDLDDALTMLFLFANLPSTTAVPPKTIALCQRLCLEFEHYLIVSRSLRKSFLSIKGIYYQATIQGQDILWLVPYKFVQKVTGDIDFRIMGTFVEFYTTLLGFVNFRLYTSIGLVYPPKFSATSDDRGAELGAFTLEGKAIESQKVDGQEATTNCESKRSNISAAAQAEADKVSVLQAVETDSSEQVSEPPKEADADRQAIDKFEVTGADADDLPQPQGNSFEIGNLFSSFTFYLSRETPRAPLEFLIKSFGCKRVGWDGVLGDGAYTTNESDSTITHQIVDKPALATIVNPVPGANGENGNSAIPKQLWPQAIVPGRTYIQPQWVWDCINERKLLRPDLYAPGATLPPHLSPWAKPKKGQYDPRATLEEQERDGEALEYADKGGVEDAEEEESSAGTLLLTNGKSRKESELLDAPEEVVPGEGMDVASLSEGENEDEDGSDDAGADEQLGSDWSGFSEGERDAVGEDASDEAISGDDYDEEDSARAQHQLELEAEAAGLPLPDSDATKKDPSVEARKKAARKRKEEEEELARQKMMLSRKKRKVLDKMLYSNKKRDEEAERLRAKRRRIEKGTA